MKLIDEFDKLSDLDKNRRRCLTYGRTRHNQVVALGDPPRVTVGERLGSGFITSR